MDSTSGNLGYITQQIAGAAPYQRQGLVWPAGKALSGAAIPFARRHTAAQEALSYPGLIAGRVSRLPVPGHWQ
jgi:hypothetical protein